MQKIISRRAIALCLFLFIMTLCMALLSAPAYSADKAIAKLTSFSGTVLIKSQGAWGVQPEKDLPLYSDDKVVTRMGVATVTFDDGAVMEIKANSNLLIRETEETGIAREVGAVKRKIRLILGKMFFRSGRGTSVNTSLETTTMVCGLRGTAGILSIDAAGVTYLYFTEGEGDTIGNFITGVAPDVPPEIAELHPVQRAAIVAAAAAEQAKEAAEKLARGEITEKEAALAAAKAAKAAAEEAKAAAEAMLDNPDESIRQEALEVIAVAEAAIEEANALIEAFLEGGDDDAVFGDSYGVFGDNLMKNINSLAAQGNESDILFHFGGDITPPVVVLSAFPDPNGTTTLTAMFTNDESGNVTYTFINATTGEAMSNAGLVSGAYDIIVLATDEAGNTSSTRFTFTLDNHALSGNTAGSGSDISGTAEGNASIIIGEDWGGWQTELSGTWSGAHNGSLSLASGSETEEETWMSVTSGSINTATGEATGTTNLFIITNTTLTRGTGTFTGNFGTGTSGTWTGTEMGTGLTNDPLAFLGDWGSYSFWHYDTETGGGNYGCAGLVAGDDSYEYVLMGINSITLDSGPYLSLSYVWEEETGDYPGVSGTIWDNGEFNGILAATYDELGGSNSAGLFYQKLDGNYYDISVEEYESLGMWLSYGAMTPIEMTTIVDGVNYIDEAASYGYRPLDFSMLANIYLNYYPTAGIGNGMATDTVIRNQDGSLDMAFGAYSLGLIGGYDITPTDGWSARLTDSYIDDYSPNTTAWMTLGPGSDDGVTEIDSTWNSTTNEISAFAAGAWVNLDEMITGVSGGKLVGTFDPINNSWQAIAVGTLIDANTFLEMAATSEGRAKLTELDIPCVQVGEVDLFGSGLQQALQNVQMNDVQFFAYSTGAPPSIWATGDVSGDVTAGVDPTGDIAILSGTGLNGEFFTDVSFNMLSYDTGTGNWNASIDGTGYVTNPIYITGGAAGNDASTTGFSGTASGIAEVLQ